MPTEMIRTFQYKLYPNDSQRKTLERWMGICCDIYNRALEHRIKAYKRRGAHITYAEQQGLLTRQRERIESLRSTPVGFERDALRRVDRGFRAFFRGMKDGGHPGFPRFRPRRRYVSMECLEPSTYLRMGRMRVPILGTMRCRGRVVPCGTHKGIRIIRRPSGWYAQIILEDGQIPPAKTPANSTVAIDVGLSSFATLSDGTKIDNPRWLAQSSSKLTSLHRRLARRTKGSQRRRRAVTAIAAKYEFIASQRRNFCHQHSTALVRKYDLIAVEELNVAGMVRSRFGKSILDAAWAQFTTQLAVKAAYAGRQVVFVNARGTSQECPNCGRIKPKELSERIHQCVCGLTCDRDHAAAQVILARALAGKRGDSRVEGGRSGPQPVAVGATAPDESRRLNGTLCA